MALDVFIPDTSGIVPIDYFQGDGVEYLVPNRLHEGQQVYGQGFDRTLNTDSKITFIPAGIVRYLVQIEVRNNNGSTGAGREWWYRNDLNNIWYSWMKHNSEGGEVYAQRYSGTSIWGSRQLRGFCHYTRMTPL